MIPYRNARLTKIAVRGTAGDYDQPDVPGADRWVGGEGIYVDDSRQTINSPGRTDEVDQTRLELPYDVGSLVVRGDVLTFTFRGATYTRTAATITGDPLVGRTRVLLEDS